MDVESQLFEITGIFKESEKDRKYADLLVIFQL